MPDARDTARAWLAEQICASAVEQGARALSPPCGSCFKRADAILNTPGVQVSEEGVEHHDVLGWIHAAYPTHAGVVIRLPAQPIEEGT